jgi:mono/diheme cytochrome c family protein
MPPPPDEPHMARHVFGAYWMAYGLFAPDERAWQGGARALADARLLPDSSLDEVHQLAASAASAELGARTAMFGQLLTSCARCHQQLPR